MYRPEKFDAADAADAGRCWPMLADEDRAKLQAYLEASPALNIPGCRLTLAGCLPTYLRPLLLDNGNCRAIVRSAIEICEGSGYDTSPPAIMLFLQQVVVYVPDQGPATWTGTLQTRLSEPPPAGADPFVDLIIRDGMPFLDRTPLRSELRKLLNVGTRLSAILAHVQANFAGKLAELGFRALRDCLHAR